MTTKQKLDAFIKKVDTVNWALITPEDRLAFFQEFEDIMAEIEQRPRYEIRVITDQAYMNCDGYCDRENEGIYIHPSFLEKSLGILGVSQYGLANALDTIAHEGRHAWQHYVAEHPELGIIDEKDRLAINSNFGAGYISSNNYREVELYGDQAIFLAYTAQIIELDARRFAREVLTYINNGLEKERGFRNLEFENAIERSIDREVMYANLLSEYWSEEQLAEYDMFKYLLKHGSEIDSDGSPFISRLEEALTFLQSGDVDAYIMAPSIRINGKAWYEQDSFIEEKEEFDTLQKKVVLEKKKVKFR